MQRNEGGHVDITPAEAGSRLDVSKVTVIRWARTGKIPGAWQDMVGDDPGAWHIPEESVREMVAEADKERKAKR
jgi:predicted site-specific integrase-resolvase